MARTPVLVDSSIWIDHINEGHERLADLLKQRRVVLHPLVIGEIAMGSLRQRQTILDEIKRLPCLIPASNSEVIAMLEWDKLFAKGIGFVDAHLLAAIKLATNATILTKDRRLREQAERIGVAYAH